MQVCCVVLGTAQHQHDPDPSSVRFVNLYTQWWVTQMCTQCTCGRVIITIIIVVVIPFFSSLYYRSPSAVLRAVYGK